MFTSTCLSITRTSTRRAQGVVLLREPLLLLGSVLRGDSGGPDRHRLAADLIHGLRLPDSQVTEVILAQVIVQVKAGQ